MMSMLHVKKYNEPIWDIKEILRYIGCRESSEEIDGLITQCISELKQKLSYKVVFTTLKKKDFCKISKDCLDNTDKALPFGSRSLAKNLQSCEDIIIFAATIGIEIDRLISKYSRLSPAKALCFQAIGAERIESLCNTFNSEVRQELCARGLSAKPRFSPGYGDFPLYTQRLIFDLLDCPRKIGLSLNESLIMSPSKSVTAIIGISNETQDHFNDENHPSSCSECSSTNCNFRKE